MRTARDPGTVHAPIAGYTHQIEVTGTPRWLVLSGQIGKRPSGEVPSDPAEQLAVALDNVTAQLAAAGMDVADLVKVTFYLVGDVDTARRREVITQWSGGHRPCMTVLYVSALAAPEYYVEVDAWACRDEQSR
ncbi:RidA family protein [Actinomadura meridiana]|uniref:RidA family protein n=1 Tax=Actinomadura meridiana TaxID=559626 RepID=A0ABP8BTI6_9ACTN